MLSSSAGVYLQTREPGRAESCSTMHDGWPLEDVLSGLCPPKERYMLQDERQPWQAKFAPPHSATDDFSEAGDVAGTLWLEFPKDAAGA